MRVGGVRPPLVAVGEVGGQAGPDGFGQDDGAPRQVQAALAKVEVGEGEMADLLWAQGVEGEQGGDGGTGRVGSSSKSTRRSRISQRISRWHSFLHVRTGQGTQGAGGSSTRSARYARHGARRRQVPRLRFDHFKHHSRCGVRHTLGGPKWSGLHPMSMPLSCGFTAPTVVSGNRWRGNPNRPLHAGSSPSSARWLSVGPRRVVPAEALQTTKGDPS